MTYPNKDQENKDKNTGTEPPKSREYLDKFLSSLKSHKWDCAAYLILFIGLFLSIFDKFFGTFLVGLIFGVYFSEELTEISVRLKDFFVHEDIFRTFVFVSGVIVLLLSTPGLVLGTLAGVLIWHYLGHGPFHHE